MATITATPNPVGVYSASVGSKTSVNFDAAPELYPAKLYVTVNGGAQNEVPGQPPNGGFTLPQSLDLPVTLPNSYRLILRGGRTGNGPDAPILAILDVETYDLRQDLGESFSASFPFQIRPQVIRNLAVRPGIDVVLVTFKTARPTIPLIELLDETGTKIAAKFGLFGGMRTEHEAFFGEDPPLALETKHRIRIIAAGGAKEVQATAEFITGSRSAEIFFDEVDIFDDSDPGIRGEGEFMFNFGAGDAVTKESFGPGFLELGWLGLDPEDDHVPLGRSIAIPQAPRTLWVQTIAFESDSSAWPAEWFESFRSEVGFQAPGTTFESAEDHQEITVTAFVDIDNDVGSTVTPFELNTGNFSIAFAMKGHIAVESKFGQVLTTKSAKKRPRSKAVGELSEAGMTLFVSPTGGVEDAQMFAYGPDNSLYYRAANKPRLKPSEWTRVPLPLAGRATVAASANGVIDLLLHRDDGGVMHSRKSGKSKQSAWRNLGGDFDQVTVTASPAKAKSPDAEVTVFGLDKDGGVVARSLAGGEWQRLDKAPATALAAAGSGRKPTVLSAGEDRRLRVHTKSSGRWRSQELEVPIPGRGRIIRLASAAVAEDLVIGAMSDDDRIRLLRWPNFPEGRPADGWEDAGSLQDLFNGSRMRRTSKPPARSRSPKARNKDAKPRKERVRA
jgi:hypothetical protein